MPGWCRLILTRPRDVAPEGMRMDTYLKSSISTPTPISHSHAVHNGGLAACQQRDARTYCELPKARSFAGKQVNFSHREWGWGMNAC
jgi:hypothetical protein